MNERISVWFEPLRSIRGSIAVNVVSSKGLAELNRMSGTQPLGSAVFEAMILDSKVNEALALHGESGLSWSQVYDIIEFFGGAAGIFRAGYASEFVRSLLKRWISSRLHIFGLV